MIEVEVKYVVKNMPQILVETKCIKEKEQNDIYYDTNDFRLLKSGNFIRVRNNERLDFKLDIGDASHLFCEETSFDIKDIGENKKKIAKIFERMGVAFSDEFKNFKEFIEKNKLQVLAPIKKKRKQFVLDDINVTVDTIENMGTFIEAEKLIDKNKLEEAEAVALKNELIKFLQEKSIIDSLDKELRIGYVELYLMKYNLSVYNLGKFKE